MSVKAMGLVWDLECPKDYSETAFRPSHKYALIAYADHADHAGKNIYPAVATIAKKTGLDERTIQRLTNDLEKIGLLVEDGQGPKRTNRWSLPYNERGDTLSPRQPATGDIDEKSSGDIPSGDIPSGDTLPPELNEPEPNEYTYIWEVITQSLSSRMPRTSYDDYVKTSRIASIEEGKITIAAKDEFSRDWLNGRVTPAIKQALIGIMGQEMKVEFVISEAA
jgi:hypothetical protein